VSARRFLAALVAAGTALVLVTGFTPGRAVAAITVPYSDPAAVGYIGLCNQQGQQVTSGSISAAPFAWRAVSSAPAQAQYDGASRTAILMAYQPIQGLAPGDWSGDQLTSSSRYSSPANPIVAATAADWSLAQFLTEFKPEWDGLLQLRIYLGADNKPAYSLHYPALDIQVTGDTWQAVDGGPVNCASGSAESIESILLPASQLQPPGSQSASHPQSGATPTTTAPRPGLGGTSAASAGDPSGPNRAVPASAAHVPAVSATSGSATAVSALAAVLVLLALAALGFVLVRRHRLRRPDPNASPEPAAEPAWPEPEPVSISLAVSSKKGNPQ